MATKIYVEKEIKSKMEKTVLRNKYHSYLVEDLFITTLLSKASAINSVVQEYFNVCPKYLLLQTCLQEEFPLRGCRAHKQLR